MDESKHEELRLRQSYSKYLIGDKSPAELLAILETGFEATKAMERGTLVDQILFGGDTYVCLGQVEMLSGPRKGQMVTPTDWMSKGARQFAADARRNGQIPVLPHELERAQLQADSVTACLAENGVDLEAANVYTQLHMLWEADGIKKQGTLDVVVQRPDGYVVIDVKCSGRVDSDFIERQAAAMGWDCQAGAYEEGLRCQIDDGPLGEPPILEGPYLGHVLVVVEQNGELAQCTWNPMSDVFLVCGREQWRRCGERWKECILSGNWPQHEGRVLEPPSWYVRKLTGDSGDLDNLDGLDLDMDGVEEES